MRTIWKFMVEVADAPMVKMPKGAKILSAQILGGDSSDLLAMIGRPQAISVWALVDPSAPEEIRQFRIFGTGHPLPEMVALEHIATMPMRGGTLIWHLFEEPL